MNTNITPPAETEAPFDAAKFFADRNAREAARIAGKPELVKAEPTLIEEPKEKSAKPTGDQRRLFRTIRESERVKIENESLKARLDALEAKDKPKEAVVTDTGEPKLEAYATAQEFADARAEWKGAQGAEKTLKAKADEAAQTEELKRISTSFEAQMKAAANPEKGGYEDWGELLKTSKAANVNIFEAAPEIYMAFMQSEYAKDVMHEWLLKPETLTFLLDAYKTDPMKAITAFHRFEGRVGREAEKPKEEKKAAPVEEKQKPRPTRSAQAPSGESPAAEPEIGSAAWMAKRNAQKTSRGW